MEDDNKDDKDTRNYRLILTIALVVCATIWAIIAPAINGYGWLIFLAFLIN